MRASGVFVTGTDTEVGKTVVSTALMRALVADGHRVTGMKPVASGCDKRNGELRNADALALMAASNLRADYQTVNPCAFAAPIAPHIAAEQCGVEIDLGRIQAAYESLASESDWVVVEGVGGWGVPLSEDLLLAEMVTRLRLPVVLVVGLRLGCINHALLTARAIVADGCRLIGWIANRLVHDYANANATIAAIQRHLSAPLLGSVDPNEPAAQQMAASINGLRIDRLLSAVAA